MIGVIIVTFQSEKVIRACVESLHNSSHRELRVVICDNNSRDGTLNVVKKWTVSQGVKLVEVHVGEVPDPCPYIFLHSGANLGFAGGVNAGLSLLLEDKSVDLFWILNPDCEVLPNTASAFAECARQVYPFALMGGRIRYHETPQFLQSDGGVVSKWSGVCSNLNAGLLPSEAVMPSAEDLDFISGASMVAARTFVERIGLMAEDYFLFYEEVDWASRRGGLPLVLCPEAVVLHHGGTSTGSGSINRRASPFTNYFNFRNRIRFMRRFYPLRLPIVWVLSVLRVFKLMLTGAFDEAAAAARGICGMPPSTPVRNRIALVDRDLAFSTRETQL